MRLAFNVLRALGERGWNPFARRPRWRAFVTWQTYYRAYLGSHSGHAVIQHGGPLVGDAARQVELLNALAAGNLAAVVWGPPGCGKSRFALEWARRLEKGRDRRQVLFVHHDEAAVREELQQVCELKRLVLIVDDAQECPEIVKLLANVVVQSSSARPVFLVCVTRTSGRPDVSRALGSAMAPGAVQELDLGRPSSPLVRSLIDKLLPQSSPMHRDVIERFVRQSYFGAVLVCSVLSGERKLPQSFQREDLRDRVCRRPLAEATREVCPIETALRALALYAALTPVAKADRSVRELAGQFSGLAIEKVEVLVDRVLAAGLFREDTHAGLRPVPDLLGDLILEEACLDVKGKPTAYGRQLLEHVFELNLLAALANCVSIGQLFGTAQEVDLVSQLVLERARTIPRENRGEFVRLLQRCQPLAVLCPMTVVEVASILESRGVIRRNCPVGELQEVDGLELDTCALLMGAGAVDPSAIALALSFGRDLYRAARGDERISQPVREQLEGYCQFKMGRSVSHARAVVETLRAWVTESDVQVAALAASLGGQFLPLDVQGCQEQVDGVSVLRTPLIPVSQVWEVRDICVDILVCAMSHADAAVQCAAVGALERYAHYGIDLKPLPIDSWHPQLVREIDQLCNAMLKLVVSSSSLPVWACVELQGWLWWVQDHNFLHQAGLKVLQGIASSDAYWLWKSLYAQRLPTRIAIPSELSVDAAARLNYFQNVSPMREGAATNQARELFATLEPRYTDLNAWRALWLTVLEQSPRSAFHSDAGAVVGEFARRHGLVAWSFLTESDARGAWFDMMPLLLMELRKQDRVRASEAAREVARGTALEEVWLRVLWSARDLDEVESALLARGLQSTDAEIRRKAAGALLHATDIDRSGAFHKVFATVGQYPADELLWELVIQQFVNWADGVLPPRLMVPTQTMLQVADELIALFQTHGAQLRWGYQRHTRELSNALAILVILHPQRLRDWMQQAWGKSTGAGKHWNDESPLGITRLAEIMRLVRQSPAASYWIDVFAQWIRRERLLGGAGALGLAQLCTLDHAKVGELIEQIGRLPTDSAVKSFVEFILQQRSDRAFAHKALSVLEVWAQFPNSYAPIEAAVIDGMMHGAGGGTRGQPSPAHLRALEAIETLTARGIAPGLLRSTLERVSREIREAMNDDIARDGELTDS